MTYNQKEFIRDALDSFIMQKTNFLYEVVIHDDASDDGTVEILKEYAEKYPDIIKPVFSEENNFKKGTGIMQKCIPYIKGKYIAMCDGDDYFIDEYKLQKQVDFMENNPDYSLCYHPMKIIYDKSDKPYKIEPVLTGKDKKNPQSFWKLLNYNYIPSNSVMYKADVYKKIVDLVPRKIYPGDWFYHILSAKYGKIGFIPDVMSVYRRNIKGVSYTQTSNPLEELHLKYGIAEVKFYYEINKSVKDIYPEYYEKIFLERLREIYTAYSNNFCIDELIELKNLYLEDLKNIDFNLVCDKRIFLKIEKKYKKYRKLFNACLTIIAILVIVVLILIFKPII